MTKEQRLCEHTPNGAATAAFQSLMRTAAGSKSFPQMLAVLIVVCSLSPPRSFALSLPLARSLSRSLSRSLARSLARALSVARARARSNSLSARGWQQVVPQLHVVPAGACCAHSGVY